MPPAKTLSGHLPVRGQNTLRSLVRSRIVCVYIASLIVGETKVARTFDTFGTVLLDSCQSSGCMSHHALTANLWSDVTFDAPMVSLCVFACVRVCTRGHPINYLDLFSSVER